MLIPDTLFLEVIHKLYLKIFENINKKKVKSPVTPPPHKNHVFGGTPRRPCERVCGSVPSGAAASTCLFRWLIHIPPPEAEPRGREGEAVFSLVPLALCVVPCCPGARACLVTTLLR